MVRRCGGSLRDHVASRPTMGKVGSTGKWRDGRVGRRSQGSACEAPRSHKCVAWRGPGASVGVPSHPSRAEKAAVTPRASARAPARGPLEPPPCLHLSVKLDKMNGSINCTATGPGIPCVRGYGRWRPNAARSGRAITVRSGPISAHSTTRKDGIKSARPPAPHPSK